MFSTTEGKMSPMSKFHTTVNTEDFLDAKGGTSTTIFSPPSGNRDWQMQIQKEFSKKVQPPMLFGKSKLPMESGRFSAIKGRNVPIAAP